MIFVAIIIKNVLTSCWAENIDISIDFLRYKIVKIDPSLAKKSIILIKPAPETNIDR